jgi:hypothetical protein
LHNEWHYHQEILMPTIDLPQTKTRLGFHYYPDTLHYREVDLQAWLPEILGMGASWLTLVAPKDRAIPEEFIRPLIQENIEPVLHFHLSPAHLPDLDNLRLLMKIYAGWGVRYITLFDRPNSRASWSSASWSQSELVESFLDVYLPSATLILQNGLIPVLPPLEPGGDYWDTAFLRAALQGIVRRGGKNLAENMVLGAYAWVNDRPLAWGAGGPERWPQAKPYDTPDGQEDQLGFYIFDWYQTIAQAELGYSIPIILVAGGYNPVTRNPQDREQMDLEQHTLVNLKISHLMAGNPVTDSGSLAVVPSSVLACNFWLLAARNGTAEARLAWFQPDGTKLPIVESLRQFYNAPDQLFISGYARKSAGITSSLTWPIPHYLLLTPAQCHDHNQLLATLWSYICDTHPTIGFSLEEAVLAERVTVLDDPQGISNEDIHRLRRTGCSVERLNRDGISIATE